MQGMPQCCRLPWPVSVLFVKSRVIKVLPERTFFQLIMEPGVAVDVQLPSILVGNGILLPIKIDITISGKGFHSCPCITLLAHVPKLSQRIALILIILCAVGARYVDTFCWKLYNSILTPDQFAWRLCSDLNLPLTFQSRIS